MGKRCPEENENPLELANRKSLFQLLSFLDSQPPQFYGIHTLVRTALLTENPEYRVYFRRGFRDPTSITQEQNNYSVIIGVRLVPFEGSEQQVVRKCWILTAWTLDYDQLPKDYSALDIDWLRDISFIHDQNYTPHAVTETFFNNKRIPGTDKLSYVPFNRFVLPVQDALELQLSCPDNVYVKSLERCHAQLIYDNWQYKHFSTVENVALGIDQLPSVGVFLKENDKLVSWAMCLPPGGIGRLSTLENYRQRGYAKLAVQYLSKRMAQSGFFPFAHVDIENKISMKLFPSLGFQLGCQCHDFQIQYL